MGPDLAPHAVGSVRTLRGSTIRIIEETRVELTDEWPDRTLFTKDFLGATEDYLLVTRW